MTHPCSCEKIVVILEVIGRVTCFMLRRSLTRRVLVAISIDARGLQFGFGFAGQVPLTSPNLAGLSLNTSAALVRANLAQRISAPVSGVSDPGQKILSIILRSYIGSWHKFLCKLHFGRK